MSGWRNVNLPLVQEDSILCRRSGWPTILVFLAAASYSYVHAAHTLQICALLDLDGGQAVNMVRFSISADGSPLHCDGVLGVLQSRTKGADVAGETILGWYEYRPGDHMVRLFAAVDGYHVCAPRDERAPVLSRLTELQSSTLEAAARGHLGDGLFDELGLIAGYTRAEPVDEGFAFIF